MATRVRNRCVGNLVLEGCTEPVTQLYGCDGEPLQVTLDTFGNPVIVLCNVLTPNACDTVAAP